MKPKPHAAVVALLAVLCCRLATASPPVVHWAARGACPEPSDLLERVATSIGVRSEALGEKLRSVRAAVTRSPAGALRMRLVVATTVASGERAFEAQTCKDIVDGTVLILGLAVDPQHAARVARPAKPAASPKSATETRTTIPLQLLFNTDLGILRDAGISFGLGIGVAWQAIRIEVDVASGLPQRGHGGPAADAELRLALRTGVRGCYVPLRTRLDIGACLGAEVAWLRGRGLNISEPATDDAVWVGFQAGLSIGYRLWRWLGLRIQGHIGVSPTRPSFEIEGIGQLHQPSTLFGRLGLALETWLR